MLVLQVKVLLLASKGLWLWGNSQRGVLNNPSSQDGIEVSKFVFMLSFLLTVRRLHLEEVLTLWCVQK